MTIKTVAVDAGVSVSAVSKVLRDAYGVSDSLRERVTASIEKLEYRPSVAARGMRGKSYTIGVLMTDTRNAFNADILEGINEAANSVGYRALIGISQHETAIEASLVEAMIDRQMDGIIMIGPQLRAESECGSASDLASLAATAKRIPTVVLGHYEDSPLLDTVNDDDVLGAKLVVDHLVEQGYQRITFVSPKLEGEHYVSVAQRRHQGYVAAMEAHGLGHNISVYSSAALAHEDKYTIQDSIHELFAAKLRPEALFCWSDLVAFEVISALHSLGYAIPGDVGVVGYDNTRACEYWQNSLSSVDQSGHSLGLNAARLLFERIGGRTDPVRFVLPPHLVVRGSSTRHSAAE